MLYTFLVELDLQHARGPKASGDGLADLLASALEVNLPAAFDIGGGENRDVTTYAMVDSIVTAVAS